MDSERGADAQFNDASPVSHLARYATVVICDWQELWRCDWKRQGQRHGQRHGRHSQRRWTWHGTMTCDCVEGVDARERRRELHVEVAGVEKKMRSRGA